MTELDLQSALSGLRQALTASARRFCFGSSASERAAGAAADNVARAAASVFGAGATLRRVYTPDCAFEQEAAAFLRKQREAEADRRGGV